MHPNVYLKLLGGVMLALGLGMMAVQAQQPPVPQPAPSNQPPAPTPKPPTAQVDPKTGALIVPLGGVVSFKPDTGKDAFSDVVVSREDVVQVRVSATDPRELLLTG
ncbi:MAG: hypothetical protein RMJ88_13900, partial [Thermogemmata sp.]|nr:hypothetical protein [Thermogemmata sp.]